MSEEHTCTAAVNEALQVIGGKWAFLVIGQLYYGARRFNELRRTIGADNVSVKSLTDILRHLERHRIVERRVYDTVPVSVEYSLTDRGREFRTILQHMREWSEKWAEAGE